MIHQRPAATATQIERRDDEGDRVAARTAARSARCAPGRATARATRAARRAVPARAARCRRGRSDQRRRQDDAPQHEQARQRHARDHEARWPNQRAIGGHEQRQRRHERGAARWRGTRAGLPGHRAARSRPPYPSDRLDCGDTRAAAVAPQPPQPGHGERDRRRVEQHAVLLPGEHAPPADHARPVRCRRADASSAAGMPCAQPPRDERGAGGDQRRRAARILQARHAASTTASGRYDDVRATAAQRGRCRGPPPPTPAHRQRRPAIPPRAPRSLRLPVRAGMKKPDSRNGADRCDREPRGRRGCARPATRTGPQPQRARDGRADERRRPRHAAGTVRHRGTNAPDSPRRAQRPRRTR